MKRWLVLAVLAASVARGAGNSVVGSKHDFSVSGPGPIKAVSEKRVCIFCHVAHGGGLAALDNRPDIGKEHQPYQSTTARARPGAPTGASRICLSCHDGTIAVGKTRRGDIKMNDKTDAGRIPASRRSNLGTDLRKTHPVSFAPESAPDVHAPPKGDAVRLDRSGQLQCTSCHDAHAEFRGSPEGRFLVRPTRESELCVACHPAPTGTSHSSSTRSFGPAQGNADGYASVRQAGCMACHRTHDADAKGRLVAKDKGARDDALCLRCHSGEVARANVAADMAKPYGHAIDGGGAHDAAEGRPGNARTLPETSPAAPRHAVCVDCHEPHQSTARASPGAPFVGGALAGAWGIDSSGRRVDPARFEYEICFKCHADSANKPAPAAGLLRPRRASDDDDLRRVFEPAAVSFHPVAAAGRGADVPSLRAPYTAASQVYCTDCHASDSGPGAGGTGARGPHGSVYPGLLERSYATVDPSPESAAAYALCYKCHDRDVLLSGRSAFPLHKVHLVQGQSACSACHVPHGISARAGNPLNNAHLVDFDLNVVQPGAVGLRQYVSRGPRSGSCTLVCHSVAHDARSY